MLDSLFGQSEHGLALWDTDLRFIRVTPALAEINDLPVAEHLGRSLPEVLPDLAEEVVQACRTVIETGRPVTGLVVEGGREQDGRHRTFICSYHPVKEGESVVGLWASVQEDTAERHDREAVARVNEELQRERAVLQEVLLRAPAPMAVMWGEELTFAYVNEPALELLPGGQPVLDRSVAEVFPEGGELAGELRDAVLGRGETHEVRDVPLGERFWTFSCVPLPGAEGRPGGVLAVGQDTTAEVTRRRELERELAYEHRIASQLQVSLMPERLPAIPGVDVASGFRPAGQVQEIGGDFYDVFEIAEGCWMVVIGDVCGKGAEAAALTALARYTLRAAAIQEGAEPAVLLGQLNEAILRQRHDMRFLTAVCAFLDLAAGGGVSARVCVAGHLPPLLLGPAAEVRTVSGGAGALLGVWDDLVLAEEVIELRPGQRLVLYTDGVLDARQDAELTEEGFADLLGGLSEGTAAATVAGIEQAVIGDQPAPGRDDVAVLVLRPLVVRSG